MILFVNILKFTKKHEMSRLHIVYCNTILMFYNGIINGIC